MFSISSDRYLLQQRLISGRETSDRVPPNLNSKQACLARRWPWMADSATALGQPHALLRPTSNIRGIAMRSSIRSVMRLAIAVGVISAYQNSSYAANLNELIHPRSKMCFLHDLDWKHHDSSFEFSKKWDRMESESRTDSVHASPDSSFDLKAMLTEQAEKEAAEAELDACILAARQFESRSNAVESWSKIENSLSRLSNDVQRMFSPLGAPWTNSVVLLFEQGGAQLVEWIQYPELIPVMKLVATTHAAPASNSDEYAIDSECFDDWDGQDDGNSYVEERFVTAPAFPERESANCFVFLMECNDSTNSYQTGMDPVCPDIHVWYDAAPWSEIACDPVVCFPPDDANVATAHVSESINNRLSDTAPSQSDTSYNDTSYNDTSYNDTAYNDTAYNDTAYNDTAYNDTAYNDTAYNDTAYNDTAYNGTAYNDTAYNDTSYNDTALSDTSYEDTSYSHTSYDDTIYDDSSYKVTTYNDTSLSDTSLSDTSYNDDAYHANNGQAGDNTAEGYSDVDNTLATNDDAIERTLPPTLESDSHDFLGNADSVASENRDNFNGELCQPDSSFSLATAIDSDNPTGDAVESVDNSQNVSANISLQCFPWLYKCPVIIPHITGAAEPSPNVLPYTHDDLRTVHETYRNNLDGKEPDPDGDAQFFSLDHQPNFEQSHLGQFDFDFEPTVGWIQSSLQSIITPLRDVRELMMQATFDFVRSNTRTQRDSLSLAKQIRTVGEFLIDFSTQLEQRVEQVSIAKRPVDQR